MPAKAGLSNDDLTAELHSCGAKVLGISFANDDDAKSLAQSMGAVELLDKTNLVKELIPAILKIASSNNYPSRTLPPEPCDARGLR